MVNARITVVIAKKDLIDAIVNMRLVVAIVLPIGMSVLFGQLFGGFDDGNSAPGHVAVVPVYDAGQSRLVEFVDSQSGYRVERVTSLAELEARIEAGDADVGLVFPAGFDEAVAVGQQPEMVLVVNEDYGRSSGLHVLLETELRKMAGQEIPGEIDVQVVNARPGAERTGEQEMLPMWLIMSLVLLGSSVVPTLLVEEKEKWTLRAVTVTPATYADVVAGKAMVGMVYGVLAAMVLLALNDGLSGQVAVTVGVVLLSTLVLVELGLLLGGIFEDIASLNTWSSVLSLALMLPGMLASFLSSGVFKLGLLGTVMWLFPTYYVLDAVNLSIVGQATPSTLAVDVLMLSGLALVLFVIVIRSLRRREQ